MSLFIFISLENLLYFFSISKLTSWFISLAWLSSIYLLSKETSSFLVISEIFHLLVILCSLSSSEMLLFSWILWLFSVFPFIIISFNKESWFYIWEIDLIITSFESLKLGVTSYKFSIYKLIRPNLINIFNNNL